MKTPSAMKKNTNAYQTVGSSTLLYGSSVEEGLERLSKAIRPHLIPIIGKLYENLRPIPVFGNLIDSLQEQEVAHLKDKKAANLMMLCSSGLTADQH